MKNLLLVALLCIGSLAEAQITLNNVTLSGKLKTDKSELTLNGGGIRRRLFSKCMLPVYMLPLKQIMPMHW